VKSEIIRETIATIIGRRDKIVCLSIINDFLLANKRFIEASIEHASTNDNE